MDFNNNNGVYIVLAVDTKGCRVGLVAHERSRDAAVEADNNVPSKYQHRIFEIDYNKKTPQEWCEEAQTWLVECGVPAEETEQVLDGIADHMLSWLAAEGTEDVIGESDGCNEPPNKGRPGFSPN